MEEQLEGTVGVVEFDGGGLKIEAGWQFEFGEGGGVEAGEGGDGGVDMRVFVFAGVDEPPAAGEGEGKSAFREGGGESAGESSMGGRGASCKSVVFQSSPWSWLVHRFSDRKGWYR